MILSQTATYALQAALCLAENADSGPMRVDDVAESLDVPRNYLSKILHALARSGTLTSTRGPGGGFQLAAPPDQITLASIVRQFDEFPDGSRCLLGRERCSDADPCQAHHRWKSVAGAVSSFFDETTLADFAHDRGARRAMGISAVDTAT